MRDWSSLTVNCSLVYMGNYHSYFTATHHDQMKPGELLRPWLQQKNWPNLNHNCCIIKLLSPLFLASWSYNSSMHCDHVKCFFANIQKRKDEDAGSHSTFIGDLCHFSDSSQWSVIFQTYCYLNIKQSIAALGHHYKNVIIDALWMLWYYWKIKMVIAVYQYRIEKT